MSNIPTATYHTARFQDTLIIQISGRATMWNSELFLEFIKHELEQKTQKFIIDFRTCEGMDSTFIGILLGIMQSPDIQNITIVNSSVQHQRILKSLGILKMFKISPNPFTIPCEFKLIPLPTKNYTQQERTQMILDAHRLLIEVNKANELIFGEFVRQAEQELSQK